MFDPYLKEIEKKFHEILSQNMSFKYLYDTLQSGFIVKNARIEFNMIIIGCNSCIFDAEPT